MCCPTPEDLYQILDNESIENELDDLLLEDRLIEEPEDLTGIKESFEPDNEEEQTESNMDIQQGEQNQNHDNDTSKEHFLGFNFKFACLSLSNTCPSLSTCSSKVLENTMISSK